MFDSRFRNYESEVAAGLIVLFCDERNEGWKELTAAELHEATCAKFKTCKRSPDIGKLVKDGFVVQEGDTFYVTPAFIEACDKALD